MDDIWWIVSGGKSGSEERVHIGLWEIVEMNYKIWWLLEHLILKYIKKQNNDTTQLLKYHTKWYLLVWSKDEGYIIDWN